MHSGNDFVIGERHLFKLKLLTFRNEWFEGMGFHDGRVVLRFDSENLQFLLFHVQFDIEMIDSIKKKSDIVQLTDPSAPFWM